MPKIQRANLPPALLQHLLDRIRQLGVSADQLYLLADWLDSEPEVPSGRWFKRFPGFIVCGESDLIRTFLVPGQLPEGTEIG